MGAKRSAKSPSAASRRDGSQLEVRVRMYRALEEVDESKRTYRGLLGDCFLIMLRQGAKAANILIDCGMLMGSPNAQPRMQEIAADIVKTCGGDLEAKRPGTLDLAVITHEHWDHLSGFSQAAEILLDSSKLKIANVWMAWTENPDDPQAQSLRERFDAGGAAFATLAQHLRKGGEDGKDRMGVAADAVYQTLFGLDGFLGATAPRTGDSPARLAGRDVMEAVRNNNAQFLEPGTVLKTPGEPQLRAFVLGPPRDEQKLFKNRPSGGDNRETYLDAPGFDPGQMQSFAEGNDLAESGNSPFARNYCRLSAKAVETGPVAGGGPQSEAIEFLHRRYYGSSRLSKDRGDALARRRIDTDWLGAAGGLALKLDSDTNNTSLALAFELPDAERTVLLFAADAQVGNWLSWHDQPYKCDGKDVTAEELLNRTRLYKVGHHGSHNATLHEKGLAMMTRGDLFALIPTDEAFGKQQGSRGWTMPDPRLYAALREATKGRILRNDRCYSQADIQADPDLRNVEPAFFDGLTEQPLYLEYRVL